LSGLRRGARYQRGSPGALLHEAQQPPLYYFLAAPLLKLLPHAGLATRVLSLRWMAVLLASLVVPLGFLLCRLVLSDDRAALGAVAVVSLMPEMMFDVARVGNECLAAPLFTLLVYLVLRFLGAPQDTKLAALLGLVLGAGLLTKAFFVTAVPAMLLLFAWAAFRNRGRRLAVTANAALALFVAAAASGWWYWRNQQMTGSWTGEVNFVATSHLSLSAFLQTAARVDWWNALDSTLVSHIWCGGWSFLGVRSWMYRFFECVALAACLGLLAGLVRWARKRATRTPAISRDGLPVLAAFYGFFWLGLAYHVVATFLNFQSGTTTGWYIYCLVVVEVLLVYAGLSNLVPRGRLRWTRWILPASAACFALLDLYATHFVALPYYTGLIAHRPNGGLEAFHLQSVLSLGFRETLARLLVNKAPFLGVAAMLAVWLAFVISTVAAVVLAFRINATRRAVEPGVMRKAAGA